MESGYTINTRIWEGCQFFYLFNWNSNNEVDLAGFAKEEDFDNKKITNCIGVWRVKKLVN